MAIRMCAFCDEFCHEHSTSEGIIPLAAGLHIDGTIHVYMYGYDSGLRIGLDKDILMIKVDESARKLM